MGKKYIIEIIDKPFKDDNGREVWRAKGFNTLYFDQNGLDKLEEYVEPVTHKFEVGDICKLVDIDSNVIVIKITPDYISYLLSDGTHGMRRRSFFECQALFIRHLDEFYSTLKGGF